MLSRTTRTHRKMTFRFFLKPIKFSYQELIRQIKLQHQINLKSDELARKRNLFATLERYENESGA